MNEQDEQVSENPYQAPRSASTPLQAKEIRAARFLLFLKENPPGVLLLLKTSATPRLLIALLAWPTIVWLYSLSYLSAATLVLGVWIGVFGRDIVYCVALTRSWPFQKKVLDWDVVSEIADESNESNDQAL